MYTLTIDGQPRTLIELRRFREMQMLPESFNITLFEDKDYTGLARIQTGSSQLNALRDGILAGIPARLTLPDLMNQPEALSAMLRAGLYGLNDEIGLKPVEIEFAVSGFSDMLQALVYAIVRARQSGEPVDPATVYQGWLDDSVRLSQPGTAYEHQGTQWRVHTINTAYGRVGMAIDTGENVHYVYAPSLACPADSYMHRLFLATADQLRAALA